LQQLLQQEAHLPSAHLAQELQLVLQHFEQEFSAAVAVASPKPAMMASMAPALINVFILFLGVGCCCGEGVVPSAVLPQSDYPQAQKSPGNFQFPDRPPAPPS
jgi:hypothetical protein